MIEQEKDLGTDQQAVVDRWLLELDLADKHEKKWRETAKKVIKKYRAEQETYSVKFNILWSNTETLKPALFSKNPNPDVRRRFLDKDPIARQAAEIIKRALSYSMDSYEFFETISEARDDYLLPGRGQVRVRYAPVIATTEFGEEVVSEEAQCTYVDWEDYRQSPAKSWNKTRWVAFREKLTRKELKEQFGEKGALCQLTLLEEGAKEDSHEMFKRAEVWTIWNKSDRKVYVVSPGFKEGPLDVRKDPLGLAGFFPCPKPLYAVSTNGSTVPIPLFKLYEDQAKELDDISNRINLLTNALKRRGVYDASMPELERLSQADDNEFIPVTNWTALMEKGGLERVFAEEDIENLARVLKELYVQREQVKQTIYEITGLSDIIRGATNAEETATAQDLKAKFGDIRMQNPRDAIQRFIRDVLRLKAEIISEHFSPETLTQMTGIQVIPEVYSLLKNEKLRGFRIDIETDSTIKADSNQEKQARIEFLTAVNSFLEKAAPAVQMGVLPLPVAKEMLMFGVRGFSVSPNLEDALEQIGETPPPEPKPDPEIIKAQAEHQREQQKLAQDAQAKQADLALKEKELQITAIIEQAKLETQKAIALMQHENQSNMEVMRQQHEAAMKSFEIGSKGELEREKIASTERMGHMQLMPEEDPVQEAKEMDITAQLQAIQEQLMILSEKIDNSIPTKMEEVRDKSGRLVGGIRHYPNGETRTISLVR